MNVFTERVQDFWHDVKAGVREKTQSTLKDYKTIRAVSALSMATKLIVMAIVVALFPVSTNAYETNHNQTEYHTDISFNKANAMPLSLNDNTKQVEIGPSTEDVSQKKVANWTQVENKVRPTVSVSHRDPTAFRPIYQAAAQQFGIPWQLIEAVHEVETGKSGSTAVRSYAGAQGPMQFMPGTWRAYAVDGNGDGQADITDVTDAIYTGAHYLAKSGADEGRIDDAIFNYNHSTAYVNKVKTIAYEIGL